MKLHLDIGLSQLKKSGEELCGDSIECISAGDRSIIVLSDGLGSGVKANILSRLTVKTASTMLKMGGQIDEVIETLASTLPMCKVRSLAYSTFSILQLTNEGQVYLAEYDNPKTFLGRGRELREISRQQRIIDKKIIKESFFPVTEGDWLVMVSDGVLHAGLGGVWNLGWGWDRVGGYLGETYVREKDAQTWADEITSLCNQLYGCKPGDDASVVVVKIRKPRHMTILVGPPRKRDEDKLVVEKLLNATGMKVVCGGTTGNLVGRELERPVMVDLSSNDERVPPTGVIEGIDLVTEGTLTMVYTLENLRKGTSPGELAGNRDGASRLTLALQEADSIDFIVGMAINPAQQSPEVPTIFAYKHQIIKDVIQQLEQMGKKITVEYH